MAVRADSLFSFLWFCYLHFFRYCLMNFVDLRLYFRLHQCLVKLRLRLYFRLRRCLVKLRLRLYRRFGGDSGDMTLF